MVDPLSYPKPHHSAGRSLVRIAIGLSTALGLLRMIVWLILVVSPIWLLEMVGILGEYSQALVILPVVIMMPIMNFELWRRKRLKNIQWRAIVTFAHLSWIVPILTLSVYLCFQFIEILDHSALLFAGNRDDELMAVIGTALISFLAVIVPLWLR